MNTIKGRNRSARTAALATVATLTLCSAVLCAPNQATANAPGAAVRDLPAPHLTAASPLFAYTTRIANNAQSGQLLDVSAGLFGHVQSVACQDCAIPRIEVYMPVLPYVEIPDPDPFPPPVPGLDEFAEALTAALYPMLEIPDPVTYPEFGDMVHESIVNAIAGGNGHFLPNLILADISGGSYTSICQYTLRNPVSCAELLREVIGGVAGGAGAGGVLSAAMNCFKGNTGYTNCTTETNCTVGNYCTIHEDCSEADTCTTQSGCSTTTNCTNGEDCSEGDGCTTADGCTKGTNCSKSGGDDECTDGDNCSSGDGCTGGPNCSDTDDCTEDDRCSEGNECTNGTGCSSSAEGCTEGDTCSQGGGCTTHSGCSDASGCTDGPVCPGGYLAPSMNELRTAGTPASGKHISAAFVATLLGLAAAWVASIRSDK